MIFIYYYYLSPKTTCLDFPRTGLPDLEIIKKTKFAMSNFKKTAKISKRKKSKFTKKFSQNKVNKFQNFINYCMLCRIYFQTRPKKKI
jgi:hypothetical protein